MYIRRKVFSIFQDEYGEERLFSTNEFELEQKEFAQFKGLVNGVEQTFKNKKSFNKAIRNSKFGSPESYRYVKNGTLRNAAENDLVAANAEVKKLTGQGNYEIGANNRKFMKNQVNISRNINDADGGLMGKGFDDRTAAMIKQKSLLPVSSYNGPAGTHLNIDCSPNAVSNVIEKARGAQAKFAPELRRYRRDGSSLMF